jgi:hypothetical protein
MPVRNGLCHAALAGLTAYPSSHLSDHPMRTATEPRYILDARRRLTEAKRRTARQERRVVRIKGVGTNASSAEAILKALLRRQYRSSNL